MLFAMHVCIAFKQFNIHCILINNFAIPLSVGGIYMSFQIKQNKKESENKTIRFPLPLIERIENAIRQDDIDISFSGFVIQACEYALDNMVSNNKDSQ